MNEPWPELTPVRARSIEQSATHRGVSPVEGIIVDAQTCRRETYRYTVMIAADEWNKTWRRKTDRAETLFFYSSELELIGDPSPATQRMIAMCTI